MKVKCVAKLDTIFSADSVECCPYAGQTHLAAVGTYQVDQSERETFSPAQRRGKLLFVRRDEPNAWLKEMDFAPILDMKWNDRSLAVADAGGGLTVLRVDQNGENVEETEKATVTEDNALALSLDWSSHGGHIVVSDSSGSVSVLNSATATSTFRRRCHDFEAWIACFRADDDRVVISGGDDGKLR